MKGRRSHENLRPWPVNRHLGPGDEARAEEKVTPAEVVTEIDELMDASKNRQRNNNTRERVNPNELTGTRKYGKFTGDERGYFIS
ncbi:unnamed protein product [Caenorhabditis auriculariae]|uniref:Uncharacterized protein n=1 Tax=Caenorhabditis auriculariae TaxID=2777116 RepID=A0A8S1HNP9_9PELO|nr:unnamed protein product [Caenorhabditis auriculariae]